MRTTTTIIIAGLLALKSAIAQTDFIETNVQVAQNVEGKLVVPGGEEAKRAILILHGFNDHMDSVGDLHKLAAHGLAKEGFGSLRINFRGEGIRNNSVITSTLESRTEDAENAYRFLKKQFPEASFGITGWSMGGSTAIILMGTHPNWFESAVFWSSGGHNLKDKLAVGETPEHSAMIKKILLEGKAENQSWTTITYTRENYASWIGFDSADYLGKYEGAFLGIRGSDDFLPLHEPEWLKILKGEPLAYHVLGGADHIFNVLDPQKSQGDTVVKLTLDWFQNTLK
ncbi:MAG: alpha/beta hydrolase [Verrucomicrobia bacterium]|nr:alpha/beta hydrolase [Verrucomicrobiota bacterium]MDA1065320.1 alpha/beta hydrolase [Verrucomicrobiota bacterium]